MELYQLSGGVSGGVCLKVGCIIIQSLQGQVSGLGLLFLPLPSLSAATTLAAHYVGYTTDPVAHECAAAPAVTKRLTRTPLLSFTKARSEQP